MTELESLLNRAFVALRDAQVPHALIGGLALAQYGAPRATADIDLLIDETDKSNAFRVLSDSGYELRSETKETAHFGGIGALDILFARRPEARRMLAAAWLEGQHELTPAVAVEDIIGLKIQAFSNDPRRWLRDQADIEALIAANPTLEWNRVKYYADLKPEGRPADLGWEERPERCTTPAKRPKKQHYEAVRSGANGTRGVGAMERDVSRLRFSRSERSGHATPFSIAGQTSKPSNDALLAALRWSQQVLDLYGGPTEPRPGYWCGDNPADINLPDPNGFKL